MSYLARQGRKEPVQTVVVKDGEITIAAKKDFRIIVWAVASQNAATIWHTNNIDANVKAWIPANAFFDEPIMFALAAADGETTAAKCILQGTGGKYMTVWYSYEIDA